MMSIDRSDWDRSAAWLAFTEWGQDFIDDERARTPHVWHPIAKALVGDRDFIRAFGAPALCIGGDYSAPEDAEGLIVLPPQIGARWPMMLAHVQQQVVQDSARAGIAALNRNGLGLYKSMPPVIGEFKIPVVGGKPASWWRASFQIAELRAA